MDVEAELMKALNIKRKNPDRQKFLSNVLLAMDDRDRFSDDAYDALSNEAADWHQRAVKAKDKNKEIPDFPNDEAAEPEEVDEVIEQIEDNEADEAEEQEAENEAEEDEAEEDEAEPVAEPEVAEPEVAEPEMAQGEPEPANVAEVEEANDPIEPDQPVLPAPKPKAGRKAKKKSDDAPALPHPMKPLGSFPEPDYVNLSGEKDRFGIVEGTKTAEAVRMYQKGSTAHMIMQRLGGRYYNVLTKLASEGHTVTKSKDGFWKLIHKDDVASYKHVPRKVK